MMSSVSYRDCRNFTTAAEQGELWYVGVWPRDHFASSDPEVNKNDPTPYFRTNVQEYYRTRRHLRCGNGRALRLRFEKCNEIGAFMKLTSSYCLIGKEEGSENLVKQFFERKVVLFGTSSESDRLLDNVEFASLSHLPKNTIAEKILYATHSKSVCIGSSRKVALSELVTILKADLPSRMPVITTSLAGCRIVGRMCVGNKNGLLLPETVYDKELDEIKNDLPDSVEVQRIEERLSALGNVIACNDRVAIIHPELSKESEEIIADTLQVEVIRHLIGNNPLVGSYCVLNNAGGLVSLGIGDSDLENLSSVLQLPLIAGTVNRGSKVVASGLVVNDNIAYAGPRTSASEFSEIESIFLHPK